MKTIGLIGCSKHKLGKDCPARLFKAKDIYIGNTFKISRDFGLSKFKCEDWYILSAKYNLLDKEEKIPYYDLYLGHQSSADKNEWAQKVLSKLKEKYDLRNDVFYIFAGSDYYQKLLPYLHCVVFNYKNSNLIDLEQPTEYLFGVKK